MDGQGQYHDFTVENINRIGTKVQIEGTDNNTGEERTLEMDDR
jgi:hypothetical protein